MSVSANEIRTQVIRILAEQAMLEPSDVDATDTLTDLGVDSMGVVEAIFAIEETFDVSVPFNANEPDESDFDITTVQSVIDSVTDLIAAQKP